MAETTLTVSTVSVAGVSSALASANVDGSQWQASHLEDTFLEISNGGGSSITATIPAQTDTVNVPGVGDVTVPDIAVAIAAGARKMIGPIPPAYIDASGFAHVTYSGVTTVTVGAFKLERKAH